MDIPSIRSLSPQLDIRGQSIRLFDESDVSSTRLGNSYLLSVTNFRAGTVRGMHCQIDQKVGPKLLTVSSGALIDVAVDIRTESPTYGVAFTAMVLAVDPVVLTIPMGFAHGYQTLEDNTALLYWLDEKAESGSGIGYNPQSGCMRDFWPIKEGVTLSGKDLSSPRFEFEELEFQKIYPDSS